MLDFFRFDLSNFTFVELGMWAACNGRDALTFPTRPDLNQPEAFNCPPATWGWKNLRYSGITETFFDRNLPKALIFHPISCGFTFCAMIAALVTIKRQKYSIALPIFSFLSCLFALISFFIDVATFVPARSKLMSQKGTEVLGSMVQSTSLGPAFWLSLACFCVDIIGNGIVIFGYTIWRYQRTSQAQRSGAYSADMESDGLHKSRRGYKAQSSITSLGDATTAVSTSRSSKSRRGLDVDGEEVEPREMLERSTVDRNDAYSIRTASIAPRMSGDGGRSTTDVASFAPSRYEDAPFAEDSDVDDDYQSARSIYEDAPQNVPQNIGSRGFSKRKPVEKY
ncbi:hypothetical protein CBS101457_000381 [Exobasidium rhododendri]|nr:hypothetical protein CBS101457_000381 [Exobasidium rhododendri]